MSRMFGDDDEGYGWLYQQHSDRAIAGRRGQAFLRELIEVLDAMPVKELIDGELRSGDRVCALGAVAVARGVDTTGLDSQDLEKVAAALGISTRLAVEVSHQNDSAWIDDATRHAEMRAWAAAQVVDAPSQPERRRCSWCARLFTVGRGGLHEHKWRGRTCPGVSGGMQ